VTAQISVFPGRYHDSVRLMQVGREARAVNGVQAVMVAMATDLNLRLLDDMGFDRATVGAAGPDDLLVAVRAVDETALAAARTVVELGLAGGGHPEGLFTPPVPRTVGRAGEQGGANLALISVPGAHAFVEAMDALEHGMHVMVFSDNVSIAQEVELKQRGEQLGLLVMGPDCGTTIIGGVGLGFANVVAPGPVGITGASGTGIQQACCLLDAAGVGVRHALGTGGRDLSALVGAASTLRALEALDVDPAVALILIVSKPPDPVVAASVERAVASCTTPVVTAFVGAPGVTLEGAARTAVQRLGAPPLDPPRWLPATSARPRPGLLRGMFSGGTLRDEAIGIAGAVLGGVSTDPHTNGHRMVDFGSDAYTRGRPHPMIDQSIRLEALASAADDTATSTVLLDVVLGRGAHPDPAGELTPLVGEAVTHGVAVVVSLCGTRGDPQGRDRQAEMLVDAGAEVYLSNAAAAVRAAALTVEANE
jgi:FdrA protein